jgi:hypothetical protein
MTASTRPGMPQRGGSLTARSNASANKEQGAVDEAVCSAPEVQELCAARGLGTYLPIAVRLARQAFGPVHEMRAGVDVDPDTDERRVVLDVTVDAPLDELLRRYASYTREWVAAAPAEVREWVRLSFHPLRDA